MTTPQFHAFLWLQIWFIPVLVHAIYMANYDSLVCRIWRHAWHGDYEKIENIFADAVETMLAIYSLTEKYDKWKT